MLKLEYGWLSYYTPLFYRGVITSPCSDPDAGVANLC